MRGEGGRCERLGSRIELRSAAKPVALHPYLNIRNGYEGNLSDYRDTIPHAFYHNAFLIVSNGDKAKYGSITAPWDHFYEWKRSDEKGKPRLDTQMLLDGMLAKERLLDLVENFVLFDASKAGPVRKIVARNHQVLGVDLAVRSVARQEELKKEFPLEKRLAHRVVELALPEPKGTELAVAPAPVSAVVKLPLVERAHPELGRLGVFWHTQGSGKSYSMLFFVEKVRRVIPGNFTFVVLTDREDLDPSMTPIPTLCSRSPGRALTAWMAQAPCSCPPAAPTMRASPTCSTSMMPPTGSRPRWTLAPTVASSKAAARV